MHIRRGFDRCPHSHCKRKALVQVHRLQKVERGSSISFATAFCIVDRGLTDVQLIISDACRGLMESAAEHLPEARWQRCMVHFYRNVFSHVPATKVREVSHMLKAIHAQESRDAADRKARAIVDDLRAAKMNTAADLVERSVSKTLTYYAFPDIHWQKIRTNNPLERIMKEIRRRTRVVGAFPDGQSCLNLAAARLRYIAGTAWSTKCYMNMRPLYQWG